MPGLLFERAAWRGVFHVFGVFDEWSVITHELNNVDTSCIGKIVATVRPTVAPSLLPPVSIEASLFQQHHVTALLRSTVEKLDLEDAQGA